MPIEEKTGEEKEAVKEKRLTFESKTSVENKAECEACLAKINDEMFKQAEAEGYTVVLGAKGKEIIGKNALTGEDAPDKARTTSWDTVVEHEDGKFSVRSLEDAGSLSGIEAKLGAFNYTKKELTPRAPKGS